MSEPVLLFDGQCSFCKSWVQRLRRWDRTERLRCVPFQDPSAPQFGIATPALAEAMHLVLPDGRVLRGADAVPELLQMVRAGWLLQTVYALPGVRRLGRAVYAWVARRRHRFGCESRLCQR